MSEDSYLVIKGEKYTLDKINELFNVYEASFLEVVNVLSIRQDGINKQREEEAKKQRQEYEMKFERAQKRKDVLEDAVTEKYGEIKYAYESWYTYEDSFDLNKVLVPGTATFTNPHAWTGKDSEEPNWEREFTNATIVDILWLFDDSIIKTGDTHHVFLEGISIKEREGKKYVDFCTGS